MYENGIKLRLNCPLIFDGVVHFIFEPSIKNSDTWPYDSEHYLILNIGVEPYIDSAFVESSMEVDFINKSIKQC